MMLVSPATIVVFVILLLFFFRELVARVQQYCRLAHIPGPWATGWSGLFILRSVARNTLAPDLGAACDAHGRLVRIEPNTLLTRDPELIRRMNAVRSPYIKGQWYNKTKFTPDRHHLFSETNESRHAELRTRMAQGYSGKELGNAYLEQCVDDRIQDLHELLRQKYLSTGSDVKPVDLARLLHYFVIDVITDIAFRTPFGFLKADADVHGYISTQEKLIPVFEWLGALPIIPSLVRKPWFAKLVMPKPTDKAGLGYLLGIAKKTVEARFGPSKVVKNDMLGSFIAHGLDQRQAELEATLQVMVGSDTTVASLRSIILYTITHPHVYSRLQTEISSAQLSEPVISDSEARNLPYLQACIKEGMRVFPPVTGLFSKRVPEGGDTVCGTFVPGGTDIAYCAWDFYKDPAIFGPDAAYFRPERWLEAEGDKLIAMQRTIDLIFGYGKYSCLGKPIAMLELGKTLAEVSFSIHARASWFGQLMSKQIFRRYDVSTLDPLKPWTCFNRNGFFFVKNMMVRMSERAR
jgi:hypothetical protein